MKIKELLKTKGKINKTFLLLTLSLLVIGLIVLYSASAVASYDNFNNTTYYFTHQLIYGAVLGLIGMFILSRVDYHLFSKISIPIILVAFIFLILVKVPGIGFSSGGASRWIHFGPIFFQPAEIAKFAVILYLATLFGKMGQITTNELKTKFISSLVIVGTICALILWQPDLGSMLSIAGTAFIMFFFTGVSLKHLGITAGLGAAALLLLIKLEPYRAKRLTTFFDRSIDPLGIGYHINQAILAIGAGGVLGLGYGESKQKHNYLPEPIGDSVFAILSEELGFIRVVLILLLFLAFIFSGIKLALNAPDNFGKFLAGGIIAGITVNVIINIGAILGLLPLTGIPLPFFSYGSSSLVVTLSAIGIMLNISRQSNKV